MRRLSTISESLQKNVVTLIVFNSFQLVPDLYGLHWWILGCRVHHMKMIAITTLMVV